MWSPAQMTAILAPAGKFLVTLSPIAMVALARVGNIPLIQAPPAGIPMAPAVLAVFAVTVPAPFTKSYATFARTGEAALVSDLIGHLTLRRPGAMAAPFLRVTTSGLGSDPHPLSGPGCSNDR